MRAMGAGRRRSAEQRRGEVRASYIQAEGEGRGGGRPQANKWCAKKARREGGEVRASNFRPKAKEGECNFRRQGTRNPHTSKIRF
jgi:hypothetical protein